MEQVGDDRFALSGRELGAEKRPQPFGLWVCRRTIWVHRIAPKKPVASD
jgi:hypothetical protein